jgi:hypothetical protein
MAENTQKPKRFNPKEEKIKNGWLSLKGFGFDYKKFGPIEWVFSALAIAAIVLLASYRGIVSFAIEPLLTGTVPYLITLLCIFFFGETVWHFFFVHGKIKKMKFLTEAVPFKFVSYILGTISVILAPITSFIVAFLVLPGINWLVANWIIKANYDRYEEFHNPQKINTDDYEDEAPKKAVEQPKKQEPVKHQAQPLQFKPAPNIAIEQGVQLDAIPDSEINAIWGLGQQIGMDTNQQVDDGWFK